ncbi:MAG: EAL domain-containing protein [Oscillospiraceae bacterium]
MKFEKDRNKNNKNPNFKDKKNNVNSYLKRKSIIPSFVSLLICFLLLIICGVSYCGCILNVLRNYKNDNYNSLAINYSQIIEENIKNQCFAIDNYGKQLSNYTYTTVDTYLIRGYLENMVNYHGYDNMYIINVDGNGFDYQNNGVNFSNEDFFINADIQNQTIVTNSDKLLYITPVLKDDNTLNFFIVAETNINLNFDNVLLDGWNDLGYYIIDNQNNIVTSSEGNSNNSYESIFENGIIFDTNSANIYDLSVKDFFKSIKSVISVYDSSLNIWYQSKLNINDWSILVGRQTTQDSDILMILSLSMKLLSILLVTQSLIVLVFILMGTLNKIKLKKILFLDTVTGGNNWFKFKMDASEELQKGRNRYALVSFDVYKFRIYCDINGHQLGDDALVEIDNLMKKFINKKEFYAHKNLDTFDMFLLYKDEKSMRERLLKFSNDLHKSPKLNDMRFAFGVYIVDNKNYSISRMSMMANMSKDNDKLQDYNLKETISFFTKEMHSKILKESDIFNSFDKAIENQEFLLYIQPKYSLFDEKLSAGEALVRWKDKDGKLISPSEFIPVFEKNGCIRKLDQYMLEAVCKKQRQWLDMGYNIVPISVNLSRACFSDKSLVKDIIRLVDSYKVPHNKIELELTESAFFDNKELLIDTVKKLRSFGFSVSMDDFGAGYSSLNSLKELPIDIVKLDGGFFRNGQDDELEKSKIIIHNIIKLAYDLNLRVVAEGVEYQEQIDFLRTLGYDILIQGYYYSKPIPNEDFETLQSKI